MSGLVFACIAPHGSLLIPLLGEKGAEKALATHTAMEELGRRVAATKPDTLVIITPHGHRVDRSFSLLNNLRVQGTLGPEPEGNGNSFTLSFEVDRELNAAIIEESHVLGVPVACVYFAVAEDPKFYMPLDWGALVPLWFLGAALNPQPGVVIACPDRNNIPWELSAPFGLSIRKAAEKRDRRIAFVASADLGHAHDAQGPYGYDIASKEFDTALIDAVKAQDLARLLSFDLDWLKRASTDSYGQVLNLHGAIEGLNFKGELLSYEVPTYFGMMCVAYELPTVYPIINEGDCEYGRAWRA
jgi:aromatic ring-opening dioxygenase LigB subunit